MKSAHEIWLLDTSASMRGDRYDRLKAQLQTLWEAADRVTLIAFATERHPIVSPADLPEAGGGTLLAEALESCAEYSPGRVVVWSDGEPKDEEAAIAAARLLPGVVDTIFFGDSGDKAAIRFMDRLACDNGGKSVKKDILAGETLLGSDVRTLLGLPAPIAL
jgi:Mg-chelatase subunit ChlD